MRLFGSASVCARVWDLPAAVYFFYFNGFCTSLQNSFIHCYPRFVPFSSILHARAFPPTRFCESDRSHTSHTAPCSPPQPFSCFLDDVASSMPPVDPLYPLSRSSHLDVPLYCMFAITKHCAQLLIFPYNTRLISASKYFINTWFFITINSPQYEFEETFHSDIEH